MESEVKRKALSKAKTRIMLADSSKYNSDLEFNFAGFEDIDYFVTDAEPAEDIAQAAREAGIKILY